jgi:hypothetical protein
MGMYIKKQSYLHYSKNYINHLTLLNGFLHLNMPLEFDMNI